MRLQSLEFWMEAGAGPLRPEVLAALAAHGDPLRWAITAAEPILEGPGVEGAAGGGTGMPVRRRLRLEAVVLCP